MTHITHLLTLGVLLLPLTGCCKPAPSTSNLFTTPVHHRELDGHTVECVGCSEDDSNGWWFEAGSMCHSEPKERKPCGTL